MISKHSLNIRFLLYFSSISLKTTFKMTCNKAFVLHLLFVGMMKYSELRKVPQKSLLLLRIIFFKASSETTEI